MLTRDFKFLKNKYRELLLPTLLMLLSDKICLICDLAVISFYIPDSTLLSAINLTGPFIYFSAVLYTLFGVGGSLLALRARAVQDDEKANHYFTVAILGVIIANIVLIAFNLTLGDDIVLYLFDIPPFITDTFKLYLETVSFYFPFNCFILTMGYFVRSDGYPKLPFISLLVANISNIVFSLFFMGVLNMGVEGSALGSVIGYGIGAVCISTYFFKENREFFITTKVKIRESLKSVLEFISNTPEIIARIFITLKVLFYSILCSALLGLPGLVAFLVYDNSETVVYMFVSAIAKVMTPIVAVFYKEKDYEVVEFIIRRSLRYILIIAIPVSIILAIYPEIFAYIFTIDDPAEIEIVCNALRITSLGLIGRCVSQLLSNYTQAIEENKLSSIMNLSEEFIFTFGGGILLTEIFGAIGIWYSLLLADTVPVIIYAITAVLFRKNNKDRIKKMLLLSQTNTITWTYVRAKRDIDSYVEGDKKRLLLKLTEMVDEKSPYVLTAIDELAENILKNKELDTIDVTIRYLDDTVTLTVTYEGKLNNPITDEITEKLVEIDGKYEYSPILGYNRAYINIPL